jgi:hypothetical protein
MSVIGRHPATLANLLGFTAFFTSTAGWLIVCAVLLAISLDMAYAALNNYRYQHKRYYYEQGKIGKRFEDEHPRFNTLLYYLNWINLIRFPFRGIAVALGLGIIIAGSSDLGPLATTMAITVGAVVSLGLAIWAEMHNEERRQTLAALKEEEEQCLENHKPRSEIYNDKRLYPRDERTLFWRAFSPADFFLVLLICGELARRAIVYPPTVNKASWLAEHSYIMEIILPILLVTLVIDLAYSLAKNMKAEYELDEQRIKNNMLRDNLKKSTPDTFQQAYPLTAKIEKHLRFMNLFRYSFRAISFAFAIMVAADVVGDMLFSDTVLNGFTDAGVHLVRVSLLVGIIGLVFGYFSERSEQKQKQAVANARNEYVNNLRTELCKKLDAQEELSLTATEKPSPKEFCSDFDPTTFKLYPNYTGKQKPPMLDLSNGTPTASPTDSPIRNRAQQPG